MRNLHKFTRVKIKVSLLPIIIPCGELVHLQMDKLEIVILFTVTLVTHLANLSAIALIWTVNSPLYEYSCLSFVGSTLMTNSFNSIYVFKFK